MDISRSLDRPDLVVSYEVVDHKTWENGFYLRMAVILKDGSMLHVREYVTETERDYSYHWQTSSNDLVCRWDNAPHHKGVATYPHHKHQGDVILESTEISLDDVLCAISKQLSRFAV